jgi:hypothetical protein
MLEIGQEWLLYVTPFRMKETTAPTGGAILPNAISLYCKDKSGTSALYWMNDAGTEFDLTTMVGGSGASGRVAFWTGTQTISSSSVFLWDNTNKRLGINVSTNSLSFEVEAESTTDGPQYTRYGASGGALWTMRAALGTQAAPTQVAADTLLGGLGAQGRDNASNWSANVGALTFNALQAFTSAARGCYATFALTPSGATTRQESVRWTANTVGAIQIVGGGTGLISATNGIELVPKAGQASGSIIRGHAYGTGVFMNFQGSHARGTSGGPTASQDTDILSQYAALGYGATGYSAALRAGMRLHAGENWTDANQGTYLTFVTTPLLSLVTAERFRVGPSGQWGIGGATFGTALDVFTSGGSAAAPTWTAPGALTKTDDTNVTLTLGGTPTTALLRAASLTLGWTGQLSVARGGTGLSSISGDWLTQYFLLAGRSGGQNAIAGTAAGDDCGLYATSNASPTVGINGSGAVVNIGIYSGATHPIATAFLETADAAIFRMKSPGSSKQVNLEWADANTRKWALYKLTTDELALYDSVNSQTIFLYSPASAGVQFLVRCHPTWAPTTSNSVAFLVDPVFTGSANGAQGFNATPEFNPSSNMAASYANLSINTSNPPAGITITQAIGAYYRNDYKSSVGVITTGINCIAAGVNITGSVKPSNQFGLYAANQGAAGISIAANLYVDPCSGATNSYDIGFGGSDGTAVGAYFGRIPILYAGLLKYLAVYS